MLPVLQHPKTEAGVLPSGPAALALPPHCASGQPSPCQLLVALTLAAQGQPRQLPVCQLMAEIHNPHGDVHLQQQPACDPSASGHTCRQPCKATQSLCQVGTAPS